MSLSLAPTRTPLVATTMDVKVSHGVVNVTLFDDRGEPIAWLPLDTAEVNYQIDAMRTARAVVTFDTDSAIADFRAEAALTLAAQDARAREWNEHVS